nr:MAG TPA: excisionase [Caudoviricetes sp.]
MTLKEVSQLTGIPYQTLLGWEKAGGYRRNLARFLKSCDRATLEKHFSQAPLDMVQNGDVVVVEKDGKFSVATYPVDGKIISVLQKFKKV